MEVIVKMFNLKIYAYGNNYCPRYYCLGVFIYYLSNGNHVGYVPKDMTAEIRNSATLPCHCICYIWKNNDTYFSDCYVPRK